MSRSYLFSCALLALLSFGCGRTSDPITNQYKVTGKVVFSDGTPLSGGQISFLPVSDQDKKSRVAVESVVNSAGEFNAGVSGNPVKLDGKPNGAVPGQYIVVVTPRESHELPSNNVDKIPAEFRSKETSQERVTIEAKDNEFTITLR